MTDDNSGKSADGSRQERRAGRWSRAAGDGSGQPRPATGPDQASSGEREPRDDSGDRAQRREGRPGRSSYGSSDRDGRPPRGGSGRTGEDRPRRDGRDDRPRRDGRGDERRGGRSTDRDRRKEGRGGRGFERGERRGPRSFETGRGRPDGDGRGRPQRSFDRRDDRRDDRGSRAGGRREDRAGGRRGGGGRRGDDARFGSDRPRYNSDRQRSDRDEPQRDENRSRAERGPRSWDRSSPSQKSARDTRFAPVLPEDITGRELDRSVWRELRTLTKENAEGVAKHLVAAATLLEEDPDLALAHAEHAARRAGRVAAVREALGLVHYRRGEFNDAIREFRTAKRLSGSNHLLPYLVDSERGLGRHERALDLASSDEARNLGEADNIELAIVVSGVRRDLGQPEAAQMVLRIPALERGTNQPWAARLFYAYAEALLAGGDATGAREWFAKALDADAEGETDAADRLDLLDGVVLTDLLDGEDDDEGDDDRAEDVDGDVEVASETAGDMTGAASPHGDGDGSHGPDGSEDEPDGGSDDDTGAGPGDRPEEGR
ncbi:tetratricopeptide repeat protein [Flexivirga sp. ID2601S]|uniref:Tetratricopeptide repeat protein n=1 Tax=Flexivirga aerilata TaxID=1656889 RepID=A0A849APG7_9MICO|nr:tetratricopeptide repeat protein [Flexivirga aerilata]NNG41311.1 tetratricopeptide repeat protein [Flexivirga aerilata]